MRLLFKITAVFSCVLAEHAPAALLYGNATLGYYFFYANIGVPEQRGALIADTGSHSTVRVCKECSVCSNKHKQNAFDTTQSKTSVYIKPKSEIRGWKCGVGASPSKRHCGFRQGYLEGSTYEGYMLSDHFRLEGEPAAERPLRHIFGCALVETDEFYSQEADGIIGLGVRQSDPSASPTVIEDKLVFGHSPNLSFAMCIAHNGGQTRFGGANAEKHLKGERARVIRSRQRWRDVYRVPFSGMRLGDKNVEYDYSVFEAEEQQPFFDTGTTFTYLPEMFFDVWRDAFTAFCAEQSENCAGFDSFAESYDLRDRGSLAAALASFPTLRFSFGSGADYHWLPEDYLILSEGIYFVGVKPLQSFILGAVFMRNYDVLFDQLRSQVRFVRADCGDTRAVTPTESPTLLSRIGSFFHSFF